MTNAVVLVIKLARYIVGYRDLFRAQQTGETGGTLQPGAKPQSTAARPHPRLHPRCPIPFRHSPSPSCHQLCHPPTAPLFDFHQPFSVPSASPCSEPLHPPLRTHRLGLSKHLPPIHSRHSTLFVACYTSFTRFHRPYPDFYPLPTDICRLFALKSLAIKSKGPKPTDFPPSTQYPTAELSI